jgi:LuxR family maltose regulon positive regulatory protein
MAALIAAPALDDGSAESLFLTAMRGIGRLELEEISTAEAEIDAAARMALEQGYDVLALHCLSRLATAAGESGRFLAMLDRADAAIAFATERGWERTATLQSTYFLAAWGGWSMLDDERTARNLRIADDIAGVAEPSVPILVALLRAYAEAEWAGSTAGLARRVREVWAGADESVVGRSGVSAICTVDLGYAEAVDDTEWAHETVARAERCLAGTGDLEVVQAWDQLAAGQPQSARALLGPVLAGRLKVGVRALLFGWQLECRAAAAVNQPVRAHEALLAMLDIAGPRLLFRPLVLAAPEVRRMLRAGQGRFGSSEDFVTRVLRELQSRSERSAQRTTSPTLTDREVTILRDLPSLLSLADIAAAHQVSENTVKTHVRSIYDKLGVHTRREAVQRATELGVL